MPATDNPENLIPDNPAKQAESFLDKFQHPFVASFISSWIICNWDIFYTLLGGLKDPFDTVAKIKAQYSFADHLSHLILLPLVGMGAYILFGQPLLNWYLLYKHKGVVNRKIKEAIQRGLEPVSKEDYEVVLKERDQLKIEKDVLLEIMKRYKDSYVMVPGTGGSQKLDQIGTSMMALEVKKNELQYQVDELKSDNILLKKQIEKLEKR